MLLVLFSNSGISSPFEKVVYEFIEELWEWVKILTLNNTKNGKRDFFEVENQLSEIAVNNYEYFFVSVIDQAVSDI